MLTVIPVSINNLHQIENNFLSPFAHVYMPYSVHIRLVVHSICDSITCRQMCRVESRRLVVGNIHVLYNPSRGDVKLGQVSLFTLFLSEISI